MSSKEWRKVRLGDACTILTGFPFKGDQYSSTGVRVIRGENVSVGSLRWDTIKCWNLAFNEKEKYSLQEGDIVIGMDGAKVGKNRALIKKEDLPLLLAQRVARLRANDDYSQDYLFYVIRGNRFEEYIDRIKTGTSIPHISAQQLKEFEFYAPKIETQIRLAQILRSIDDKIELNRHTNITLEAIAQAIFKEWFIDFNYPGATGELVDSERGLIPNGWRIVQLGEITDLSWGDTKTTKSSYLDEGYMAYSASGPDGFLPYHDFSRDGIVVSAIGAYSGRTWFAHGKWSCIKNTIRFWSIDQDISNEYLFLLSSNQGFWPLRGSAQPFISQTDARNTKILYPTDHLANQFGLLTGPLYSKVFHNLMENNILIKIRDSLLPELMDGTFIV